MSRIKTLPGVLPEATLPSTAYKDLDTYERTLFGARIHSSRVTKLDFTIVHVDPQQLWPATDIAEVYDIPPIEGSISSEGCPAPYIFMSQDENLLLQALMCTRSVKHGIIRTIKPPSEERIFLVGFSTHNEAEMFHWGIVYDPDFKKPVYFNGHRLFNDYLDDDDEDDTTI